jgi:hypothetical protein
VGTLEHGVPVEMAGATVPVGIARGAADRLTLYGQSDDKETN